MQRCANKFFCSSLEVLLMVAWHLLGCFGDKIKINISLTVFSEKAMAPHSSTLIFPFPVRLPSEIQKLPPDPPLRGFRGVWKLTLLRLPSQDGSPSLALLSLFLSFIFCPTSFQRQWTPFLGAWWPQLAIRSCFVKFALRSVVLSMNL